MGAGVPRMSQGATALRQHGALIGSCVCAVFGYLGVPRNASHCDMEWEGGKARELSTGKTGASGLCGPLAGIHFSLMSSSQITSESSTLAFHGRKCMERDELTRCHNWIKIQVSRLTDPGSFFRTLHPTPCDISFSNRFQLSCPRILRGGFSVLVQKQKRVTG